MEPGQLRAFLAVAEELHFARASERLHIAQPHLSRVVKQFERELGTRLFDCSTRSVELTASGQALVAPARQALAALHRASSAVRLADHGLLGTVRIAFGGLSNHVFLAELARTVRTARPEIQLELSSLRFGQTAIRELLLDEADLAIGHWDTVPDETSARIVMRDSLVVALPDTHPLAGDGTVGPSRLAGETFVALPSGEGSVLADRLRGLGHAGGFAPRVAQTAPDTPTALALVGAEAGLHLTFASLAATVRYPHVAFAPIAPSPGSDLPDVHLRAAWRRDDRSPALLGVLAHLRTTAAGRAGGQPKARRAAP